MKVNLQQELSPVKFCVFIKPNSKSSLLESIKCMFSVWCGVYAPILPFYNRFSKKFKNRYFLGLDKDDFYKNIISNFDPDVIIYEDGIDQEELIKYSENRSLITLSKFIEGLRVGIPKYSICIDTIIDGLIESDFKYSRTDNLKFVIPKINKSDLLLNAWQGAFLDNINKHYVQTYLLEKPFVEETKFNYNNFNSFLDGNNVSIRVANIFKTNLTYNRHIQKDITLYFVNPSNELDIIDYWNLRALGWELFPIPVNKKDNESYETKIIEILKHRDQRKKHFNTIDVLISKDYQDKPILDCLNLIIKREKLKVSVRHQNWFPRFWEESNEILNADFVFSPKVYFDSKYQDLESEEGDYVSFELPSLPFETNKSNDILYKSYISLSYWDDEGKYAEVISGISTEDWVKIVKSHSFRGDWKVSNHGIVKYISYNKSRASFYLPKAFKFFTKYFARKRISINETASGKLGYEVLKNIGGLHGANLFSTQNAIKIIELFEGGNIVSIEELTGKIKKFKPYPEIKDSKEVIDLLLNKQIIEFGIRIQCTICQQRSFYLPSEMEDELKCSVCRNNFELPKSDPRNSLKYVFRGIGPFSRNNKVDGLLSVFLTLRLFKLDVADGLERLSFIFDFDAKKEEKSFEVDLAIIAKSYKNGHVPQSFICECKTFKSIGEKDYLRLRFFGEQMPDTILVVATLKNEFSDEEKILLKKLVDDFRTGHYSTNPVLLLTGNELIPNERYLPLSKYNDVIPQHSHINYIKELADLTCKEHLDLKTCSELFSIAWDKKHKKTKVTKKS